MKIFLTILFFIQMNVLAEAKLTIAFIDEPNNVALAISEAKIRQALIEIYGEDWFKSYLFENVIIKPKPTQFFVGNKGELILAGWKDNDKESFLIIKEALDYLSLKEDTLYCNVRETGSNHIKFMYVINRSLPKMLFVGQPYGADMDLKMITMSLSGKELGLEYWDACKEKGCLLIGLDDLSEVDQKDLDLYYEFTRKKDKRMLTTPLNTPVIISDYYYEYDEKAKVRYIEQTFMKM